MPSNITVILGSEPQASVSKDAPRLQRLAGRIPSEQGIFANFIRENFARPFGAKSVLVCHIDNIWCNANLSRTKHEL